MKESKTTVPALGEHPCRFPWSVGQSLERTHGGTVEMLLSNIELDAHSGLIHRGVGFEIRKEFETAKEASVI